MITKVSHVTYFVLDQQKAYDFYVTTLLQTPDCRATYEELKAKGVQFKGEPKEQFYGIEAIISDGQGNWFSMTQPTGQPAGQP